ncbi:MAG: hypothetical protein QOE61_6789 [Micromonosporaceae bacterium]|jgi:hypothetical protein|nr:hypothetical protein [Micromonosporaceae bacterium]
MTSRRRLPARALLPRPYRVAGDPHNYELQAVTNDQQRTFVERVRNGKAEWVDVVTGLS